MKIAPYLHFNGNCAEAFALYEKALGGKIVAKSKYGDAPSADQVPPGWGDKLMHAHLVAGSTELMGSDAPPQHYAKPQGMSVSVNVKSADEARRIFDALAAHGQIKMPFEKTFWSAGFGMCVDQFGIPWMVNTDPA